MPPRRRAPAPIPIDVESVRRKLAEGKIVRVGISRSAQFPEGGTGRVRYVGDPGVDGEEYIQVELSLNGTKDVLPFTPADLTPATRAKSGPAATAPIRVRAASVTGKAREPAPRPTAGTPTNETSALFPDADAAPAAQPGAASMGMPTPINGAATTGRRSRRTGPARADRPEPPLSRPGSSTSEVSITSSAASTSAFTPAATAKPGAAPPSVTATPSATAPPRATAPRSATAPPGTTTAPSAAPPSAPTATRTKVVRGPKRTPAVAISIATTETDPPQWRIEAKVGARVVLRSGSVSPARVWDLVRILDDETLIRAVGTILEDQRKAAQARADALAAELAQVRAELDALPDGRA